MVINKHGSFYMRSGWGTKIIDAVSGYPEIFSPSNEQVAIDQIGLGRILGRSNGTLYGRKGKFRN